MPTVIAFMPQVNSFYAPSEPQKIMPQVSSNLCPKWAPRRCQVTLTLVLSWKLRRCKSATAWHYENLISKLWGLLTIYFCQWQANDTMAKNHFWIFQARNCPKPGTSGTTWVGYLDLCRSQSRQTHLPQLRQLRRQLRRQLSQLSQLSVTRARRVRRVQRVKPRSATFLPCGTIRADHQCF